MANTEHVTLQQFRTLDVHAWSERNLRSEGADYDGPHLDIMSTSPSVPDGHRIAFVDPSTLNVRCDIDPPIVHICNMDPNRVVGKRYMLVNLRIETLEDGGVQAIWDVPQLHFGNNRCAVFRVAFYPASSDPWARNPTISLADYHWDICRPVAENVRPTYPPLPAHPTTYLPGWVARTLQQRQAVTNVQDTSARQVTQGASKAKPAPPPLPPRVMWKAPPSRERREPDAEPDASGIACPPAVNLPLVPPDEPSSSSASTWLSSAPEWCRVLPEPEAAPSSPPSPLGSEHSDSSHESDDEYDLCVGCDNGKRATTHKVECQQCGKSSCLPIKISLPSLPDYKIESIEQTLSGKCKDCF